MANLTQKNLASATFEEKRGIIDKLDIRVYPSEDLKPMRVIKVRKCLQR